MKLKKIIDYLEHFAPVSWQEDWDNAGLQLGDYNQDVKKIVLALDADDRALEYCKEVEADLLITHHPLIFSGLKSLKYHIPEERIISEFIKNNISVYSMHTNIDKVPWGTNYALAKMIALDDYIVDEPLFPEYSHEFKDLSSEFKNQFNQRITGFVSVAEINSTRLRLLNKCRDIFKTDVDINFENDAPSEKVAISGGSFDKDWIDKVYHSGIDTIITGEMKYHDQILCRERNMAVIVLGHDVSENPVCKSFAYILKLLYNSRKNADDYNPELDEFSVEYFPRLKYDNF